MNRTVNLTKRVQTSRGLRHCPVVLAANGRVRTDLVIVNRQEERHPEGGIVLGVVGRREAYPLSVGKDAADASARRLQIDAEFLVASFRLLFCCSTSADRNGSHGETRHCTSDFVGSGNVAKFIDLISCQILEVVKFCDVHPLLHQEIFVRRIPTRASWSCRRDFQS